MGVKIQKPGDPGHPGGNRRTYVRVNYQGQRKTRVFNTSKGAEGYAARVEALLKLGNIAAVFTDPTPSTDAAPPVTFKEATERWLAVDGAAWKAGTLDSYQNIVAAHLLPAFGPRPVDSIRPDDLEAWWAGVRRRGLSRKHLGNIRNVVVGIFRRAVAGGLLPRNPADALRGRLGREDREVRQAEWLTAPELTRLLAAASAHAPRYHPFFLVQATGGLRFGEALGLQVGDVDRARGCLLVRRSIRKHRITSPKSGKARTVYLPASTVEGLGRWLEVVQAEAAVRGREPLWLFPGPTSGEPVDDALPRAAFRRCLKAAGITRRVRLHDLRHGYASLAIQAGVPLLKVSRQLGHASVAITADVCGHLAPDAGQEVAATWEGILAPAPEAPGRNPGATSASGTA